MEFSKGDILVPKGRHYPEGAVVVDGVDESGGLIVYPVGGGFQHHVRDFSRYRLIERTEQTGALFRRSRFVLADSSETFEGRTNGELWNGWEKPRFEKPETERLLGWLEDPFSKYDGERDAFITVSQDGDDEFWLSEVITISDGSSIRAYPLGAGAWIWEEAQS